MESMADGIEKSIQVLFEPYKKCPECGSDMWRPKHCKDKENYKGRCLNCLYREPGAPKGKTEEETLAEFKFKSDKRTAIAYYGAYSIMTTKLPQIARLKNFKAQGDAQKDALEFARNVSNKLVRQTPQHVLLTGPTGVGKTHLASSIIWQCMMLNRYDYRAIFIDFQEYINKIKESYEKTDVKDLITDLNRELERADLVVLDDLGAERGTEHNIDQLDKVMRLREDKNLIVTTNLSGREIKDTYGNRTLSRLLYHLNDNSLVMNGMTDYRKGVN